MVFQTVYWEQSVPPTFQPASLSGVRAGMDECVVCMLAHMIIDPTMKQKLSPYHSVSCGEDEMDALESQSSPGSLTVWC